jgi:uroporphyrinogen III methyltransferase / synthase
MKDKPGKVYLVGSGPGDASYLTIQARDILAEAEVLVYDALVDGALLDLVPEGCLKLDVGKRGGQPSMAQGDIDRLLVKHCRQGKQVVRLKSGDPFVFGRAQAEVEALVNAGCEYDIAPGLSSALVAPLLAGIPITDPALSRCFAIVTAHAPDRLDWVSLSRMDTLVILMGGSTLPETVRRLRGHGKLPQTPIAIIRWAGRPDQQIWAGTLGNILQKTDGESLSPCVIVIGEVVKLRGLIGTQGRKITSPISSSSPSFTEAERQRNSTAAEQRQEETLRDFREDGQKSQPQRRRQRARVGEEVADIQPRLPEEDLMPSALTGFAALDTEDAIASPIQAPNPEARSADLPLSGQRILVTRAASQSSQFTDLLQTQGATIVEMPTLEIGNPSSWRDLDRAIDQIEDFNWLILTSTNGVDYFFKRLKKITGSTNFETNLKIAVVGEKTAQRLEQFGIQPDFIPPNFVADSLVDHFPEPLSGLTILFPRVESGGREVLVQEFVSQGAKVREAAAYESRCPDAIAPAALEALKTRSLDIITFASSKTVQNFCQLLQHASPDWQTWLEGLAIAAIGPQTSKSCRTLLGRVDIEATEYTLDGLTAALIDWISAPPSTAELNPPAEPSPDPHLEINSNFPLEIDSNSPGVENEPAIAAQPELESAISPDPWGDQPINADPITPSISENPPPTAQSKQKPLSDADPIQVELLPTLPKPPIKKPPIAIADAEPPITVEILSDPTPPPEAP